MIHIKVSLKAKQRYTATILELPLLWNTLQKDPLTLFLTDSKFHSCISWHLRLLGAGQWSSVGFGAIGPKKESVPAASRLYASKSKPSNLQICTTCKRLGILAEGFGRKKKKHIYIYIYIYNRWPTWSRSRQMDTGTLFPFQLRSTRDRCLQLSGRNLHRCGSGSKMTSCLRHNGLLIANEGLPP